MKVLFYYLFFFGVIACTNNQPQDHQVIIKNLTDVEEQSSFLIKVANDDQAVRKNNNDAIQTYGYNSIEHLETVKQFKKVDSINFLLIKEYLDVYGYPTLDDHGEEAVIAPWIIMQHFVDLSDRQAYAKYLLNAFKKGDIGGDKLTFFLNRSYDFMYGGMMKWGRPYSEEEELDTLLKSLNLEY